LTNYELDYDRAVPPLSSTLSAALYYQVDQDFLSSPVDSAPQFSPAGILAESQNFGSATAIGGEYGINGSSPNGLRWNADYSLFTVHQHLFVKAPAVPFDFSDSTPVSAITFGVGDTVGPFEVDLQGKWQSRYTDDLQGKLVTIPKVINNYTIIDARIGYNVTSHLTLAVAGSELTAPQVTTTAALPPDRRVLFSATYGY